MKDTKYWEIRNKVNLETSNEHDQKPQKLGSRRKKKTLIGVNR